MEYTIIIAAVALLIGIIAGALLHKIFHAESVKNRRLESRIEQLNDRHTHYQAEVSSHFSQTADLLGRLNANYRDIFNHLAKGAEILGNDDEFRDHATNKLELQRRKAKEKAEKGMYHGYADPPRDYAPKADPEEKGMLAEDFGFKPKVAKSAPRERKT
jgi:uncharacterized membrane-anchored protein YhcB (DUF1043 family)